MPAKRGKWLRRVLALGGLLLVAGTAVGWLTRDAWLWPRVQQAIEQRLSGADGARLTLGELGDAGPGWVHADDIALELGVAARPWLTVHAKRGALTEVRAALLRGKSAGLAGVSISGARVVVDLEAPRTPRGPASGRRPFELGSLPGLDLDDAQVELRLGPGRSLRLDAARLQLDARGSDGARALTLSGQLQVGGLLPAPLPRSRLELDGILDGDALGAVRLRLDGRPVLDAGRLSLGASFTLEARPTGFGPGARIALQRSATPASKLLAFDIALELTPATWTSWLGMHLLRQGVPADLQSSTGSLRAFGELVPGDALGGAARAQLQLDRYSAGGLDWSDLDARLSSRGGRLTLESARASIGGQASAAGEVELRKGALDLRILERDGLRQALHASASLEAELRGRDLIRALGSPADRARWGALGPLEGSALARLDGGALRLDELSLSAPTFELTTAELRLEPASAETQWQLARLAGTLDLAVHDLAPLGRALDPAGPALGGRLTGALALGGTIGFPALELELDVDAPRWGKRRADRARLLSSLVDGGLEIAELKVSSSEVVLDLSGGLAGLPPVAALKSLDLDALRLADVRVNLALDDSRWLDARLPGGQLDVQLGASGSLRQPLLAGQLTLAADARQAGTTLRVNLEPEGAAHRIAARADFPGGDLAELDLAADWRFDERALDVELRAARWSDRTDNSTLLQLLEPGRARLELGGRASLEPLRLAGAAGALELSGGLATRDLSFGLRANRLDLQQLQRFDPRWGSVGLLDLDADGVIDIASRHGTARIEASLGGALAVDSGVGTSGDLQATLDGNQLALHSFLLDIGGLGRAKASGTLTLDDRGRPTRPMASGSLDVALETAAIERWLEPLLGAGARDLAGLRASGRFELDSVARLSELRVTHAEAGADLTGELEFGLPWGAEARPSLLDLPLTGSADGRIERLQVWSSLLPFARQLEGTIELEELALDGSLNRLSGSGSLALSNGRLQLATGAVPTLDHIEAQLRFESGTLLIRKAEGLLGGAPLTLAGQVDFNGLEPAIELLASGQGLPLVRTSDLRLRGDAQLRLSGTPQQLRLDGSLQLTDSRYTRDVELLEPETWIGNPGPLGGAARGFQIFSLSQAPFDTMRLDVRVTSEEPLVVRSNLVRGGVRPDLILAGTGRVPELHGVVYVDPTSVALPATRLRVTSGTVRFDPGSPFLPRLDLRAETRMRGYDLTLAVTGPYDAPEIVVSSVPPLSTSDALILIGTGQLPESALSAAGGQQTARLIAVYLAQDLSAALFGADTSGDGSIMERIELVKGQDVAPDGTDTIEASFLLGRDTILIGDRLLLVGEYDRYKEVNFGLKLLVRFR